MKQFLLFVLTAVLSLSAGAQTRTFTDQLVIELGGKSGVTAPINAQVLLTEHDGKVDLELRNFVFKAGKGDPLGVGHIKLSNLPVAESVDMKAEGYVTADSLTFVLDFKMPRMQVPMQVKFGRWATTGLHSVLSDPTTEAVYTLGGRRLNALPARGGVYIVGGRKVVR